MLFISKSPHSGEPIGRYADISADKLRGGYYTSIELAEWIADWSIDANGATVLEPSCGDGVFLAAAARKLRHLGASPRSVAAQVVGIEIIKGEAAKARMQLQSVISQDATSSVEQTDFFEWWSRPGRPQFDAVLGNPPFIRYQTFPEPHRSRAMAIMEELGLKPNKLTNIWVPFVAAATAALVEGGRLGLVIPAELLQVKYAAQLRTFLVSRFSDVHVVACNELLFDGAEQEVVLLLASGAHSPTTTDESTVAVSQTESRASLFSQPASKLIATSEPKQVNHGDEKWLKYFLDQREIDLLRHLRASGKAVPLGEFSDVQVGVVTGKNEVFVVSADEVDQWGLKQFVQPLVGRSAQLVGATFSKRDWRERADRGDRVFLMQIGDQDRASLSKPVLAYLERAEALGHHLGYKCSIRTPWYDVPSVWTPDAFLFRQIHTFPRVVRNLSGSTCTDTIHRMRIRCDDPDGLVAMTYTSLTGASAEVEGRSYGGGVLELEPREATRMLVPGKILPALPLEEIDRLIRAGDLQTVLDLNDEAVLGQGLGLSKQDRTLLRSAWDTMRNRRHVRRKPKKGAI